MAFSSAPLSQSPAKCLLSRLTSAILDPMKKLPIAAAFLSLSIAAPVFACPNHEDTPRTAEKAQPPATDAQGKESKETAKSAEKAKDAKPADKAKPAEKVKDAKPADKVSQR